MNKRSLNSQAFKLAKERMEVKGSLAGPGPGLCDKKSASAWQRKLSIIITDITINGIVVGIIQRN